MRLTFFFPVLFAAALLQTAVYYGRLPERLASHFNGAGVPNGWMSKSSFFAFYLGLLVFMTVIFNLAGRAAAWLPPKYINLPNRDYWLAPSRRAESVEAIAGYMHVFALATLAFMVVVFQQVIKANLSPPPLLPLAAIGPLLGGFGLFVVVWMVRFFLRFRLPADG
jgi:uncharacterized membrane protein